MQAWAELVNMQILDITHEPFKVKGWFENKRIGAKVISLFWNIKIQ